MEFNDVLNVLQNYMFKSTESSVLFGNRKQMVDTVIKFVLDDIRAMQENKAVQVSPEKINSVNNIISIIKNVIISQPFTTEFSQFTESFLLIVDNWNKNSVNNEQISVDVLFIERYRQHHFSTIELLSQVKNITKKLSDMQHFTLPSIDMSRHYLASFDEQLKNKGIENRSDIHAQNIGSPAREVIKVNPNIHQSDNTVVRNVVEERTQPKPIESPILKKFTFDMKIK